MELLKKPPPGSEGFKENRKAELIPHRPRNTALAAAYIDALEAKKRRKK